MRRTQTKLGKLTLIKRTSWLAATASIGCLALFTPAASAKFITVPSAGIVTIQDAIDAAAYGDIIAVKDGTYPGGINFNGKPVWIYSENGPDNCIIDGGGNTRGVTFTKGEGDESRLQGFTITNCRSTEGGGIHIESRSSPAIVNCIIKNNLTGYWGGGISIYNSSPGINGCVIQNNTAAGLLTGEGGGVSCRDNSNPVIANCTILGNTASWNGGGIHIQNSSPLIVNCRISGNTANSGDHGGKGGGISIWKGSSPEIRNCVISGNWSDATAGAFYLNHSFPLIRMCTITVNSAYYFAGGLQSEDSIPTITDSIIWGNSGESIRVEHEWYPNRNPVVIYSDIAGGGFEGVGNINADPLFVNQAAGDFHLRAGSPCIDSGSDALKWVTDLDGVMRPQDGDGDGIAIGDMGAYETEGPPPILAGFLVGIPEQAFRNPNNRTALQNKVEVVLALIERGEFSQALKILQNDILRKVDGCARSNSPDKDDWIVDCRFQALVCQRVIGAIEALQALTKN